MTRRGVNPRAYGFVMLVAFILAVWLKNVYDDRSSLESDIELYKISSLNKDTSIMILSKKVDSLMKIKPDTVFVPKKDKPIYKPKVDTTTTITVDSIKVDTIPIKD